MLGQALDFLKIHPDFDLDLMLLEQTLFDVTSRALGKLDEVAPDRRAFCADARRRRKPPPGGASEEHFSRGQFGHRRESVGKPFLAMCRAMRRVVETFDDVEWVYPVHLNLKFKNQCRRC